MPAQYVCLLVRSVELLNRKIIAAFYKQSFSFGVVAEVQDSDLAKAMALFKPVENPSKPRALASLATKVASGG